MSINNSDSANNALAPRGNAPANALMRTARFRRVDAPEIVGRPLDTVDDLARVFTEDSKGKKCIRQSVKDLISEARHMGDFATFHLAMRLRDTCIDWYRMDAEGLQQLMERPDDDWAQVAVQLLNMTQRKPSYSGKIGEPELPL